MATARVAQDAGQLVKVSLRDVPLDERRKASRSLRERMWRWELDPKRFGHDPPIEAKMIAFSASIDLERAALFPRKDHLIPESALLAWLAKKKR